MKWLFGMWLLLTLGLSVPPLLAAEQRNGDDSTVAATISAQPASSTNLVVGVPVFLAGSDTGGAGRGEVPEGVYNDNVISDAVCSYLWQACVYAYFDVCHQVLCWEGH